MSDLIQPIRIQGLAEFNRALRKIDSDLPKALRLAQNEAAQIVVDWAKPRVPKRSGKAARSVKAKSTRTSARVSGGGARVPYLPFLDYGGSVGRNRSVKRPFLKGGRYIYPGYARNQEKVAEKLTEALVRVASNAGIEVTDNGG